MSRYDIQIAQLERQLTDLRRKKKAEEEGGGPRRCPHCGHDPRRSRQADFIDHGREAYLDQLRRHVQEQRIDPNTIRCGGHQARVDEMTQFLISQGMSAEEADRQARLAAEQMDLQQGV